MGKAKYEKGEKITTIDEMLKQEFIFDRHKILHRGWFGSWRISFAMSEINRGVIFKAKLKEAADADR